MHKHAVLAYLRSRARTIYVGWWVVGGAVGIEFLLSLLLLQAYGTYAAIWRDEFGWSSTALAFAYSLHRAETGLLGPAQGWLLQRFGPLHVMRWGAVLLGASFVFLTSVHTLSAFYLTFALMALGSSLMGILSLTTVIVNWFDKNRAAPLALLQSGMSLGGLAVPLLAWALLSFGWRRVAFCSGLLILSLGLLLIQGMRVPPEDRHPHENTRPVRPSQPAPNHDQAPTVQHADHFTPTQALRMPAFWYLAIGHALGVTVMAALLVHFILHLNEGLGYSLPKAATTFSIMMLCTVLGHVVIGIVGDKVEKRAIAACAMLGHAGALLVLCLASSFFWVLTFAVVNGFAWGIRSPLMSALRADYFGRRFFPTIMGLSSVIVMAGSMTGPILAGVLADSFGSYRLGFAVLAILSLAGSFSFLLAAKPVAMQDPRPVT